MSQLLTILLVLHWTQIHHHSWRTQYWAQYYRFGLRSTKVNNHFPQPTGYTPVDIAQCAVCFHHNKRSWSVTHLYSTRTVEFFSSELVPCQSITFTTVGISLSKWKALQLSLLYFIRFLLDLCSSLFGSLWMPALPLTITHYPILIFREEYICLRKVMS